MPIRISCSPFPYTFSSPLTCSFLFPVFYTFCPNFSLPAPHPYPSQTFDSVLVPAPSTPNAFAMYGPTTGMLPAKPAICAKKSPNSTKMPYSSMIKPKNAQRIRIRRIPRAKAAVPFHFWRRAKKARVFVVPIMRVRPIKKRIYSGSGHVVAGEMRGGACTLPIANL